MDILREPVPSLLARGVRVELIADMPLPGGRIEVYEKPIAHESYVMGLDFALGIVGRDYDTACIYRRTKNPPFPQVAEAQGHWGPSFDRIVWAMHKLYNEAFVLGEANNTGTMILRRLWDDFGVTFMFGDRDERVQGRRSLKRLGCWKGTGSLVLPKFRRAVLERSVALRSKPLIAQMRALQFRPKSSIEPSAARDDDMQVSLSTGGSPDLVMAAAYGFHAINEVGWYEEERPEAPPGSIGDILGYNETFKPENTRLGVFSLDRPKRRG